MITMTPEVLRTYTIAIAAMDPNHALVLQERGAYERNHSTAWFELNIHLHTAHEMADILGIEVSSVRTKAYRLGLTFTH